MHGTPKLPKLEGFTSNYRVVLLSISSIHHHSCHQVKYLVLVETNQMTPNSRDLGVAIKEFH